MANSPIGDFPQATLPRLLPLEASHTSDCIEDELKRLFLLLFEQRLAASVFDVNVLGAAHLGSFDLVRRAINQDGLVLLQGDHEKDATRYLYRAWRAGNMQGRGLHFLRTYLQLLLPNQCEIEQLWHRKSKPYPSGLHLPQRRFSWWLHQVGEPNLKLDGTWGVGRPIKDAQESRAVRAVNLDDSWLTSRVDIALDLGIGVHSVTRLIDIIRAILPARLVPSFRFRLGMSLSIHPVLIHRQMNISKQVTMRMPWQGRVISERPDVRWKLGRNELRGHASVWRLRGTRISGSIVRHRVRQP